MEWVIIIFLTAGAYALVWYLKKRKKTELSEKGRYVERGNAFFKQGHFFFTIIPIATAPAHIMPTISQR